MPAATAAGFDITEFREPAFAAQRGAISRPSFGNLTPRRGIVLAAACYVAPGVPEEANGEPHSSVDPFGPHSNGQWRDLRAGGRRLFAMRHVACHDEAMTQRRGHVALLGDSIFDNAAYTSGAPDVATHLRHLIAPQWTVSLLAEDGAMVAALASQLQRVPEDASHLVISVGGNDALQNIDLLSLRVTSSAQALEAFAPRLSSFERAYRTAVKQAIALGRCTAVCTIYNGALDDGRATAARIGLAIFNDAILRAAIDLRVDTLELRSICTDPADYANPIEPSGRGGLKIARSVAILVGAVTPSTKPAHIWGNPDEV